MIIEEINNTVDINIKDIQSSIILILIFDSIKDKIGNSIEIKVEKKSDFNLSRKLRRLIIIIMLALRLIC